MRIKILFIQYAGEDAPVPYVLDSGSGMFEHRCKEALKILADSISGHAVIEIEINGDAVRRLCGAEPPFIVGKVRGRRRREE